MGSTAALIALGAGGALGSGVSGLLGASSAKSNNEKSLEFSKWSQLQSQEYNKEMYEQQLKDQEDMYNKYQSPASIAHQLRAAGINPSAGNVTGSTSMSSVPSAGSSSPVSAPTLENEGQYYGKSIEQVASAISNISGAALNDSERKQTLSLLQGKIEALNKQNQLTESNRIYQDLMNDLTKKYGDSKWSSEIAENLSTAYLHYLQGDLAAAQKSYNDALTKLAAEDLPIKQAERANIATKIELGNALIRAEIATEKERAKTEKSTQSVNYSSAYLNKENAQTVKELRSWQVGFQQAKTELAQTESFVKRNTLWEQCESYLAELRAKKMLPEQVEQAIQHAKKENDWYEVNQLLGIVDTGTKVAGAYYGAKAGKGFVDAQNVRNEIQSQYNKHIYDKDNEAYKARRSSIAGSGDYLGY